MYTVFYSGDFGVKLYLLAVNIMCTFTGTKLVSSFES